MDYLNLLQDSIDTSVDMKIFKHREESSFAHIFMSSLIKLPLSTFNNVDNFDVVRLQRSAEKAYPVHDRPRGDEDISSVTYFQKQIQNKEIMPIWMIEQNKQYILLDGAHRIVASYIEDAPVYAYIITLNSYKA